MSKMHRTRKQRRQSKQVMRFGTDAKRRHTHPGGRSGRIRARNLGKGKWK